MEDRVYVMESMDAKIVYRDSSISNDCKWNIVHF